MEIFSLKLFTLCDGLPRKIKTNFLTIRRYLKDGVIMNYDAWLAATTVVSMLILVLMMFPVGINDMVLGLG